MENPKFHREWLLAIDRVPHDDQVKKLLQEARDEFLRQSAAGICGASLLSMQYHILKANGYIE